MRKVVYLACPYSHKDFSIMEHRFNEVTKVSAKLIKEQDDLAILSPITQSHIQAEHYNLPTTWEFWKEIDTAFLNSSDELWILLLPGWEESVGVNAEFRIADKLGIPIKYLLQKKEGLFLISNEELRKI